MTTNDNHDAAWQEILDWAEAAMERGCNVLFCSMDKHEGDEHCDATGYSWSEPTPASPVVAHVYDVTA